MYIPSNQLDEKIYCYDVNSLYPSVMINKLRARAISRQARDFAEAALEAEQQKLESGKSTTFVVLELQTKLTRARSVEIQPWPIITNHWEPLLPRRKHT